MPAGKLFLSGFIHIENTFFSFFTVYSFVLCNQNKTHKMDNNLFDNISLEITEKIKNQFISYTSRFTSEDEQYNFHIQLKIQHTKRVCNEIRGIAQALYLPIGQQYFAEILAVFHDIGRFEQYHNYRTFSDAHSENHSQIGIQVLKKLGLLDLFTPYQQQLICNCVLNHNKPKVPEHIHGEEWLFSSMVRDADKLDIWYILTNGLLPKKADEKEPHDGYRICEKILETIKKRETVTLSLVKQKNDWVLFRLSWVFDINFKPVFELISKRDIVNKLINELPESPESEEIKHIATSYILEKSKQLCPSSIHK